MCWRYSIIILYKQLILKGFEFHSYLVNKCVGYNNVILFWIYVAITIGVAFYFVLCIAIVEEVKWKNWINKEVCKIIL